MVKRKIISDDEVYKQMRRVIKEKTYNPQRKIKINIFKPTIEIVLIATVLFFLIILAQIAGKGCHSVDQQTTMLFLVIGTLSYLIWRNME